MFRRGMTENGFETECSLWCQLPSRTAEWPTNQKLQSGTPGSHRMQSLGLVKGHLETPKRSGTEGPGIELSSDLRHWTETPAAQVLENGRALDEKRRFPWTTLTPEVPIM